MLVLYASFYIGFGLFKKDWAGILTVALGTAGWIIYCISFGYGTWWFNTCHMFLIGILVAKYEDKFSESCKKLYALRLAGTILICPVLWFLADNAGGMYLQFNKLQWTPANGYKGDLFEGIHRSSKLLLTMKLIGTDGAFFGHAHLNSTSVLYEGIRWTFGLKTGAYDKSPEIMGGTLITLLDDSSTFTVTQVQTTTKDIGTEYPAREYKIPSLGD
jgi:hypothetical protein